MPAHPESSRESAAEITSVAALAARVTWMLLGPMVAGLIAVGIATRGGGWLTLFDGLFAAAVAWIILGRWYDQRNGSAALASGQRATDRHFRRYLAVLLAIAGAAWVTANVLGNHVLV